VILDLNYPSTRHNCEESNEGIVGAKRWR